MAGGYETDRVVRIETNLDDCSPEILGAAMDKLFAGGALDVFLTPILMKKNRSAVMLSVLCEEALAENLAEIIFAETSAFGLRRETITRLKLERRLVTVATPFGAVQVKLGLKLGRVMQIAPEFESCRAASERSGQPLRAIYAAAAQAYAASGGE